MNMWNMTISKSEISSRGIYDERDSDYRDLSLLKIYQEQLNMRILKKKKFVYTCLHYIYASNNH